MKYAIKVTGTSRYDGEYTGADTIPEAIEAAKPFVERMPKARIRVVSFEDHLSFPDGKVITHAVVQEGEPRW